MPKKLRKERKVRLKPDLLKKTHIIACATVAEELRSLGVPEKNMTVLEFGLHNIPQTLHVRIQAEIDKINHVDTILLGYGLCSNAAVGLSSKTSRLVVPAVDDCISIFLGSNEERRIRALKGPGVYYLTKGWLKAFQEETARSAEKYGIEMAEKTFRIMMKNYTHFTLINTGNYQIETYRKYAKKMAEEMGLAFDEIPGSNRLLIKMIQGDWDSEFVLVEPEETISCWAVSGKQ